MAQSNLAREPSMDEILASIRRIIENNEAVGPGQPANDTGAGGYHSDHPYGEEDLEEIELTIDEEMLAAEFEAEQGAALNEARLVERPAAEPAEPVRAAASEPASRAAAQPIAPPPLSLADVAARVRAASDRQMVRPEQSRPTPPIGREAREPAAQQEAAPPAPARSETSERRQADAARESSVRETLPRHPLLTEPMASLPAAPTPAPRVEPAQETPAAETAIPSTPVSETRMELSEQPSERPLPAILSAAVGEQVSRAFNDLALAVDSSPRRSFDEIAEDMLRPMLQEWLDDNLPTLVERLVREEIERVARGPRR